MDYLRDLSDFIDDLPDHDPFGPVALQLPTLEWHLTTLLRKLRAQIDAFKVAQRECRTAIITDRSAQQCSWRGSAPTLGHNLDANWAAARQRSRRAQKQSSASTSASAREVVASVPRNMPCEIDVPVSPNMSIRCIEVPDIAGVRRDGVLYYIPRTRRFAIRIAGFTLQGNIGTVYVAESSPQKIHDCDMQSTCNLATCRYYHNPVNCPGSTDIRNFAATSWLYHPGAHTTGRPSTQCPKKMRKLSSRNNLDEDILSITSADLSYFNEQLMHDLLCGIIMNYYVRR